MSLQDRLAGQDSMQLLITGASLSLVTASSATGSTYNFPLMLFGIVTHEMHSSTTPFRQFLILILFTGVFDLLHFLRYPFTGLVSIISFILLLLKIPIFLTCLSILRERGGDLRWGQGGWGIPAGFQGLGRGTAASGQGQSNWSAPGFNAQPAATTQPAPPGSFPSSGGFRLGGDEDDQASGGPAPGPPPGPGRNGYQTIA